MIKDILARLLLTTCLLVGFSACSSLENKELSKNQTLLDEADLYMEFGQLQEAEDKATKAIDNLNLMIAKYPSDTSFLLLHARALVTKFLIINSSVISDAQIQPKSLMRIPSPDSYIDYDKYVRVALIDLRKAQEIGSPMPVEERAALHAMLASIARLKLDTMSTANVQYKLAIKSYQSYLEELKHNKPTIGSNAFATQQVQNQIRLLSLSRAEVKLAMQKWDMGLRILKEMMAGNNLDFFDHSFHTIESKIASLQKEAEREHERTPERANTIADIVAKKRSPSTKAKELAGYSSYQINIMQAEIELASIKNNLIYRIICYHWLKQKSNYEDARVILRKYYPALDADLTFLLENS